MLVDVSHGAEWSGGMYLVDLGEILDLGTVEDTQGQRDHLEILGAGGGGDVAGLGADIVDDGALEPRDEEVGSLVDNLRGERSATRGARIGEREGHVQSRAHQRDGQR